MFTEEIKERILKHYLHGAFHEIDLEVFRSILHPQFTILNPQADGNLSPFTRDQWQQALEKRQADLNFDYASNKLTAHFRTIDVEEDRACVTVDLSLEGKKVYTDFLLLMRMEGAWKVVSKVFHQHC